MKTKEDEVIPTWGDCSYIPKTERNPLEQFVYANEPAGNDQESEWRKELTLAVKYIIETHTTPQSEQSPTAPQIHAVKLKVDKVLASGLVNQSELARLLKVDKAYINRKINNIGDFRLLDSDYQKIFNLFSDLIW